MKIQTTLLCGLLLSTPVFAAPINNKALTQFTRLQ